MENPFKNSKNCDSVSTSEHTLGGLQGAVKSYFNAVHLTPAQTKRLEGLLLSTPVASHRLSKHHSFVFFLQRNKLILLSNLATAFAVACFFIVGPRFLSGIELASEPQDIVSEVAVQPDASRMPADFDLEGHFESLQEQIDDSLPREQMFNPNIPLQITKSYTAYEGRFFLVNGQQGVSINMKSTLGAPLEPHLINAGSSRPSTLYIVKLNHKSQAAFPQQKTLRKLLSATGKINHVYAWREGMYGYAVVQPPPPTPE